MISKSSARWYPWERAKRTSSRALARTAPASGLPVTRTPWPRRNSSRPSSRKARSARSTVLVFTPRTAAISRAGGRRAPGRASPSAMALLMAAATWSCNRAGSERSMLTSNMVPITIASMHRIPVADGPIVTQGLLAGGVVDQARRRQRHRRVVSAAVLASVGMSALGYGLASPRYLGNPAAPLPAPKLIAPSAMLATGPALGCTYLRPTESPPCRALGLMVQLTRPAVAVSGSVSGHRLSLTPPDALGARSEQSSIFVGTLQTVGLPPMLAGRVNLWAVATYMLSPSLAVWLRVDYGSGEVLTTATKASLDPAWCGG